MSGSSYFQLLDAGNWEFLSTDWHFE